MSEYINPSQVFLDNPSKTCDEALEFLSKKAAELGIANDEAGVLKAFKAREAEGSTGMMGGFAIPHGKTDAVNKPAILVVKFANDVEWKSMDGKPIRVAIALLTPESQAGTAHLEMLSKVAVKLMDNDFVQAILAADSAEKVSGILEKGLAE